MLDNEHPWQKAVLQKKGVLILMNLAEQLQESVRSLWHLSENLGHDAQACLAAAAC
jgi:hypothetical protein